jgi:Zn-finger nucleic acid-binding protein
MSIYRQGPAPANACPRCREPLITPAAVPNVRVCEKCGGVFADLEASRRIVARLDRVLLEVGFDAALGKKRKAYEPRPIACPECLVEMQQTLIRSAICEIDACPAHGTWFDTGELEDVMRAYARARKRGIFPPGSAPVTAPAPTATQDDAILDIMLARLFNE